jgi:hypothetical protein
LVHTQKKIPDILLNLFGVIVWCAAMGNMRAAGILAAGIKRRDQKEKMKKA